jgi:GNAT superfamily N-acetyltransferase
MKLVAAEGPLLARILDLTYPVWHEGLTRAAYELWNDAQMRTPWGRQHLQRLALLDDRGELLATAKRYRFAARLGGVDVTMCGVGALFTPPDRRGQGFAGALIEQLLERERSEGAAVAGLFSEIGSAFYERRGFQTVPIDEVSIRIKTKGGAPAMQVRAGDDRDLPAIAAMHDVRAPATAFALRRDKSLIYYALAKKRMLAGLGPAGLRQVEFFVVEEGASAVAYVVLSQNKNGWTLEEAGDRDPAGARLGAMLQVLIAREPTHAQPCIRTWWPPAFPVPPQLEMINRNHSRDILMMRALADVALPLEAQQAFYWRSDYF